MAGTNFVSVNQTVTVRLRSKSKGTVEIAIEFFPPRRTFPIAILPAMLEPPSPFHPRFHRNFTGKVDFSSIGRERARPHALWSQMAGAQATRGWGSVRRPAIRLERRMLPTQPAQAQVRLEVLLPAMQHLSESQRIFLARYLSNGRNAADAVSVAYPRCKSAKAIQIRGLQVLARKSVRRVLALHRGQSDSELKLDLTLADVRRLVRRSLRRNAGDETLVDPLNRILETLAAIAGVKSND